MDAEFYIHMCETGYARNCDDENLYKVGMEMVELVISYAFPSSSPPPEFQL